ncbi:MAG: hypothetical protein J1F31_05075 [Erysipelotrichales bacterium]|nr:hypothetical protein [Erysipelotrichales bacterium]
MKYKKSLWIVALAVSVLVGCSDGTSASTPSTSVGGSGNETVIKEKDLKSGIKFLYGYTSTSQQYYWEELASDAGLVNYYYYDLGTSKDNNITLPDPGHYGEYKSLKANTMRLDKKRAPRREVEVIDGGYDENGNHKQFEGPLSEDEFFSYAKKLSESGTTSGAKEIKLNLKEDVDYVYWENELGYKSLDEDIVYRLYENNYLIQDITENKLVAIDKEFLEHKEVVEKSKGRTTIGKVDNGNYIIEVMHKYPTEGEDEPVLADGEKYPIPDNYRSLTPVRNGNTKLSDYYAFSMNSGLAGNLSKDYYYKKDKYGNEVFNKGYEWYASSRDANGYTTLQYNRDMEFDGIYSGQRVVDTIYVTFDTSDKIVTYGYDYVFYFYGAPLQAYTITYDYSYESVGNYIVPVGEDALFDYNKYHDYGALLPNLEHAKNSEVMDDKAEDLVNMIFDDVLEDKINEPTGAVSQTYSFIDKDLYKSSNREELYAQYLKSVPAGQTPLDFNTWYDTYEYDYDVEFQTNLDSSLYSDNVIVSYYSEQGSGLDEYFYAESGTFQKFNKDGKTYEIRTFNGTNSRYGEGKYTSNWESDKEPQLSLFDLNFNVFNIINDISFYIKESKKATSNYMVQVTAEKIPEGIDESTNEFVEEHYVITVQATQQQQIVYNSAGNVESATVGVILTYEIGFQVIE